jgi:hypothetical protein
MLNSLRVRQELIERGLPEHVADGFVLNFQDESGLDPGINEAAPTVPGSRGGFGLAQWTGPRRNALEQFAAATGRDVADPEVQFDFLMEELRGPEREAFSRIMSTDDPGSAAAAIVQHFERPAQQYLDSRLASYSGQAPDYGSDYAEMGNVLRGPDFNPNAMEIENALRQPPPPPAQNGVLDVAGAFQRGQMMRDQFTRRA